MKTNTPVSQPSVAEAPERIKVVVRAASHDNWIGVAYQKDYRGDPSTIHEYVRAPPSDSITQKALRAVNAYDRYLHGKLLDGLTEERRTVLTDIIAAEFSNNEGNVKTKENDDRR